MKKILFIMIALVTISTTIYASFPVTEYETEQSTEQSAEENSFVNDLELPNLAPVYGGGPGMGIAALCCGVLGFFFLPYLLGPCAIVLGALGMNNSGRGMAIAGLVLGVIQVLLVVIVLLLVGAALSAGAY